MWNDGRDEILQLYAELEKIEKFPAKCPVCKRNTAHLYMDLHNSKTRRGGLWVWCSDCYAFSHSSIYVPEYWENCSLVEKEKLCAIPNYLNEMKEVIDAHVGVVMKNRLDEGVKEKRMDEPIN